MLRFLLLFVIFVLSFNSFSQIKFNDPKSGKTQLIDAQSPQSTITIFLERLKGSAIEFNGDTSARFPARVKNKKGDWQLVNRKGEFEVSTKKGYHQQFPFTFYENQFSIVEKEGVKQVFYLENGKIQKDLWFEEIYSHKTENFKWEGEDYYLTLKRNDLWALAHYAGEKKTIVGLHSGFNYKTEQSLPDINEIYKFIYTYTDPELEKILPDIDEDDRNVTIITINYAEIFHNIFNDPDKSDWVLSTYPYTEDFLRFQDSSGGWHFYRNYLGPESLEEVKDLKGYKVNFPTPIMEHFGFYIVEKNGKSYFLPIEFDYGPIKDIWFDDLKVIVRKKDSMTYVSDTLGKGIKLDKIVIQKNDKYAVVMKDNMNNFYQLTGFHFDAIKELPDLEKLGYHHTDYGIYPVTYYNEKVVHNYIIKHPEVDLMFRLSYFSPNSSQLYKIRNHATQKWNIYSNKVYTKDHNIPVDADTIQKLEEADVVVYEVWKDGKVGVYDEFFENYKPCEYDEFKYVSLDYTYGLALRKGEDWELFYADSFEKAIEGSAPSIDNLMDRWLNR